MSKHTGYSLWMCDVQGCKSEEYIKDDQKVELFQTRTYTDKNGFEREVILCRHHAQLFDIAHENFLIAVQNLMSGKKEKVD
ncbi:hypothetical protein [Atopobium fossor]|uniref:hypothetical protein n=1 Tax=Atopobium fossor TaxID=39487 RepID=UPI0004878208|nr:hypothetical protein [Atopobium fossor]